MSPVSLYINKLYPLKLLTNLNYTNIYISRKLQMEEEELNKKNLEMLRKDEMLAREVQENSSQPMCSNSIPIKPKNKHIKLKTAKIDSFLIKKTAIAKAKQ